MTLGTGRGKRMRPAPVGGRGKRDEMNLSTSGEQAFR